MFSMKLESTTLVKWILFLAALAVFRYEPYGFIAIFWIAVLATFLYNKTRSRANRQ